MVMSTGSGGSRKGRRRSVRQMADINITPMVDVMLVLLIIFMVAAPMLTVGVPVNLPKTHAGQLNQNDQKPLVITVKARQMFIGDMLVDAQSLVPKLEAISDNNHDLDIYVKTEKDVDYGRFLGVMADITSAGFSKVSLLSDPDNARGRK